MSQAESPRGVDGPDAEGPVPDLVPSESEGSPAWELIDSEIGRYMPRRIRGSFRGRALG